jgi:uncharacterized BrkB/YihY/UPF0761 family membrane protein
VRARPRREISASDPAAGGTAWADRGRLFRTLTFWLRPAFALRVIGRFQQIAGFDRAIALASSALTGLIPLAVVIGAVVGETRGTDIADWIIERFHLSGAGAEAVDGVFSPTGGTSTGVSVLGAFFLVLAVLSFTRTVQRLFEHTWELSPLSVRNTLNGMRWLVGLLAYAVGTGFIHVVVGDRRLDIAAALLVAPVTLVFLVWSGWRLSAKRIEWRDLVPFGVVAAGLTAAYAVVATVYVPRQFDAYAARYGVIGAVLALISTLFCIMVIVVASAALGREVRDELVRIRDGRRPPDDEVRREWEKVIAEARSRWRAVRARTDRRDARNTPE